MVARAISGAYLELGREPQHMDKRIQLKVSYHSSGTYTLMESVNGKQWKDLKSPLLTNSDKGEFYRAVARHIARRAKGADVTYKDTQADS